MDPKLRKYAVIGLYVALAAALTALGLYIVFKQFNLGVQVALGFVVIGLAFFSIINPQRVREFFHRAPGKVWFQCPGPVSDRPWNPDLRQLSGLQIQSILGYDQGQNQHPDPGNDRHAGCPT